MQSNNGSSKYEVLLNKVLTVPNNDEGYIDIGDISNYDDILFLIQPVSGTGRGGGYINISNYTSFNSGTKIGYAYTFGGTDNLGYGYIRITQSPNVKFIEHGYKTRDNEGVSVSDVYIIKYNFTGHRYLICKNISSDGPAKFNITIMAR